MADVSKIKLPSGTTYNIKDDNALPLTGGSVTGPVSFGDSVSINEATIGDLTVNGSASFTNNLQANTINGVTVGSNPKFTDTTYTSKAAALGGTDVSLVTTNEKYQWNLGRWNGVTLNKTLETATSDLYLPCMGSTSSTEAKLIPVYDLAEIGGSIPRRTSEGYLRAKTPPANNNSTIVATTAYVSSAINALPEPMIFKGSVGTDGTITSLPTAAASNEGYTYKVITALSSPAAKVGDTVISNGSEWIVIPSGDEPSGTVTSIGITNGGGLSVSGSPITSSGTITISHADTSSQASSSNSGRTYIQSLTLDTYGHVTGISTATETVTNSDEKLKLEAVANGIYYPIVGKDAAASVRQYDTTGLSYQFSNGTTTTTGIAKLILGNNTGQGTAGNKEGRIKLFGPSSGSVELYASTSTQNRLIKFPDQDGTVALTSDIPTVSYPVTSVNSKTGAVSLTASDVGALASNTTYVSTITTTAGAHTAISKKSGAVSFNVPTKTSHLTNDSGYVTSSGVTSITLKAGSGISLDTDNTAITTTGTRTISHADTSSQASSSNSGRTYIQSLTLDSYGHVTGISTATESVTNTDTKLQVAAVTSGTQYYPIVGTGTSAATRQYDTTGFKYKGINGTTSTIGSAILELGNSTASGTANNKQAQLIMYGSNAKKATITLAAPSADVAVALPTSSGTLALTSQIPSISVTQKTATGTNIADVTVNGTTTQLFAPNGGGEHEDLTQAEYDALTEAEKMDGTVYFITDSDPIPTSFFDAFYPIGSYYETSDVNFNPNRVWGGTWVLEAEGQVHIGAGENYVIGDTGGEETHTLTIDEMPKHNHDSSQNSYGFTTVGASSGTTYGVWYGSGAYKTNYMGGDNAHNNMPPYIVVNRWHRIA